MSQTASKLINSDGWSEYCIWEHSEVVRRLYAARCRRETEEMTCAAQAVELLQRELRAGQSVLDVGCGSGYLYHSLAQRGLDCEYIGIDAAPSLIQIGREIMPEFGLPAERLQVMRIEDLAGEVDHIICLNVLSNIDNFHRPLERLLRVARQSVILRESVAPRPSCQYVKDNYLDDDVDLKVYVHTYAQAEFVSFFAGYGFQIEVIEDRRTQGEPELIIDYPHHWQFFRATKCG